MFQFLFKYPIPVFTRGRFVLLSPWPAWVLVVLIAVAAGGLALVIRWRLRRGRAQAAQLAGLGDLGHAIGHGGAAASAVVAAGDDHR